MKKTIKRSHGAQGFTLVELLVAMGIFLIVSSVAFSLFNQQQTSALLLRDQAGLNLALRNAITQMQVDIANAGSGYYQSGNMPSWPVGVTIVNTTMTSSSCYNQTGYPKAFNYQCFDQLNIIAAADPNTFPPVYVTNSAGGNSETANTSNTTQGYAYVQLPVVSGTTWTAAQTANEFKSGDEVLFVTNTGQQFTTAKLTANASVVGSLVKLTFNATNSDGTNAPANDPLGITTCNNENNNVNQPCGTTSTQAFGILFGGQDYVIKINPIQYVVCAGPGSSSLCADTSSSSPDIQNPKLYRFQKNTSGTMQSSVVMDQVIGLRIAAALYNTSNDSSVPTYQYPASTWCSDPSTSPCPSSPVDERLYYNFTTVRSIRISLIGRTVPNYNASYKFRNTYNQQPYQIQGMAVVVNPRNMSMNDQ